MRGVIVTMRSVGLALSLAVLLVAPADAAPNSKSCAAPHELRQLRGGLARTATRLARQEPLTIVAIGSSSTFGYGASSLALSYPSQLAVELRRRIPAETIKVHNEGVSGQTSIEMLERFDRDVFVHQPDLVIWQVGTNAVLHDLEPVIRINTLADSWIEIAIRPWVPVTDYGSATGDIYKYIVEMFREHNIVMPFPQREVRIQRVA